MADGKSSAPNIQDVFLNYARREKLVVTVHLLRRDGFDGPVDLALAGAPPEWRLEGARIPAGSEPASGSVRPKQPISSPAARPGRYFSFCASLP